MPCLQKNGAVTPQYRQRLCPAAQGRFFHAVLAHSGRAPVSKTTGRWFESTRMKIQTFCKQKTASVSLRRRSFLWARVDYASRAAKNSPLGCFCPFFCDGAAAVRIHPPSLREGYYKTETPVPGSDTGVLGGRGWIARAALLKTAHLAVFALSSATAPQLFESTRSMSLGLVTKQKPQRTCIR